MQIDDTYRSFLTMVSLGVNHGLLELIKELNETRAQIAHEGRLKRQYELLGNFQGLARQAADADGADKEKKMSDFLKAFENTVSDSSPLPDETKHALMGALKKCVVAGQNYNNEMTFEQAIDSTSLSDEEKLEYKAAYRNAMNEADRKTQPFYVFQIDIDDNRAAPIAAAVEKQLREQGIPAVALYHDWDDGKCFIHVFDADAAGRAKTLLEDELCKRAINNIRSEASLQAIAAVTGQNVITYSGLSKSEAGKMFELGSGKHFPVYISEGHNGEYYVMFLDNTRTYAEKILAESIVQTGGYSDKAGLGQESSARQAERERIEEYVGEIYSKPQEGENLGYVVDASQKGEGNRIKFGPDRITHITKDGKETTFTRDENPDLFEDRVRTMVNNFAKDFVLVPAEDARKMGLYKENFQVTPELKEYMGKALGTGGKRKKEDVRDAYIEQRFYSWAIKESSGTNAREIFSDIGARLDQMVDGFKKEELRKIDMQFASALKEEGSRQAAEEKIRTKKENFNKDFDRIFIQGKDTIREHNTQFLSSLRNVHEKRPDILKSAFEIKKEQKAMVPREAVQKISYALSEYGRTDLEARDRNNSKGKPHVEDKTRDTSRTEGRKTNRQEPRHRSSMDQKAEGRERNDRDGNPGQSHSSDGKGTQGKDPFYYMDMQQKFKAQLAARTGLSPDNPKVVEMSRRYAFGQNAIDSIKKESWPHFTRSRELIAYADAYLRLTTDGKSLYGISDEELQKLMPELQKVVMKEALNPTPGWEETHTEDRQEDVVDDEKEESGMEVRALPSKEDEIDDGLAEEDRPNNDEEIG